jgi:hypothetical protein
VKAISRIEQEVNQIRLNIYEQTKDLTPEQYKERLDSITTAAANRYGFKIVASTKERDTADVIKHTRFQ